jgi:hypothetical protein
MHTIPKVHIFIESIFEANKKNYKYILQTKKDTTRQTASTPREIDPQSFWTLPFATSVVAPTHSKMNNYSE